MTMYHCMKVSSYTQWYVVQKSRLPSIKEILVNSFLLEEFCLPKNYQFLSRINIIRYGLANSKILVKFTFLSWPQVKFFPVGTQPLLARVWCLYNVSKDG